MYNSDSNTGNMKMLWITQRGLYNMSALPLPMVTLFQYACCALHEQLQLSANHR